MHGATVPPAPIAPAVDVNGIVAHVSRQVAAAVWAGVLVGFVIAGWGSRLAMMLLARLNPEVTGRLSDDGFVMGRFDLAATMELVTFGTFVGIFGGVLVLLIRGLRFGPPWFRWASMTVGPAVVVGALLVHTDGIDFRILEPTWLAIALFVLLPGLFAAALVPLVDRWTADGSGFMSGSRWHLAALALLIPAWPVLLLVTPLLVGRLLAELFPRAGRVARDLRLAWVARAVFVAIFLAGAVDLSRDTIALL